jgi:hypothetical protein
MLNVIARFHRTSRCLRTICVSSVALSLMTFQIAGCSVTKIPGYKADSFGSYTNQVAKGDLHLAVQPMTDKDQQKTYFNLVLTDAGVLPVFIIAENRSTSRRFQLRDDGISLRNRTTEKAYTKPFQSDMADDSHLEGVKRTAGVAGPLLLSLPIILVSVGLAVNSQEVKAIQDNIFDKTLYTQTVMPGKSAEGFAFFRVRDGKMDVKDLKTSLQDLSLKIQVTDESSGSTDDVEFGLP